MISRCLSFKAIRGCVLVLLGMLIFSFNDVKAAANIKEMDYPISAGTNYYYVASGKAFERTIEVHSRDRQVDVNLSLSSNITCSITNLKSDMYSFANNRFTLLDLSTEGTQDTIVIGKISCTLPTTSTIINLSESNNLRVEISHVNNVDIYNTESSEYKYHFGVINKSYVDSLNSTFSFESLTVDGEIAEPLSLSDIRFTEISKATLTVKANLKSNLGNNKLYVETVDVNGSTIKREELGINEKIINIPYGKIGVIIEEQTEKYIFLHNIKSFTTDGDDLMCREYGFNTDNDFIFTSTGVTNTTEYGFNRIDNRSTTNTLASLTILDKISNFKPLVTTYSISVPNTISQVEIKSTLTDAKSKYVKNYGNRTVKLNVGKNTALIKVESEKGVQKTYTIIITRDKSEDNSLKTLTIDGASVALSTKNFSYEYVVPSTVKEIKVLATPTHDKAKVEIETIPPLVEGDNKIQIIVTAENGIKQLYVLNVIREKEISDNCYLKELKIKDYQINFAKNTLEYKLKINKEEKLEIEAVPESNEAKVLITGNMELKNKSVIKIRVTAESGDIKNYLIEIEKEDNLLLIIVVGVILGISIVGIVSITIKNRKKNIIDANNTTNITKEENNISNEELIEPIRKNDINE